MTRSSRSFSGSILERRAARRRPLETNATVHLANQEFRCRTCDLSHEGMALAGHSASIPQGTFMRVQFKLPRAEMPIDVDGILVRTNPSSTGMIWGLKLLAPGAGALAQIDGYVDAHIRRPGDRSAATASSSRSGVGTRGVVAAPPSRPSRARKGNAKDLDPDLQELYDRAAARLLS